MTTNPFILYEASLITDLECLERRADRGEAVYAREVTRLLESYGTSFDELPHYPASRRRPHQPGGLTIKERF